MSTPIARVGDQVRDHLDVEGNEVVGSVSTGSPDVNAESGVVARNDDNIFIPSHAHQLTPTPSDFRSHNWRIVGTGNSNANGEKIAVNGDGGNDADWDGFQTLPSVSNIVSTTTKTNA